MKTHKRLSETLLESEIWNSMAMRPSWKCRSSIIKCWRRTVEKWTGSILASSYWGPFLPKPMEPEEGFQEKSLTWVRLFLPLFPLWLTNFLCSCCSSGKKDANKGVIYKPAIKQETEAHAWGPGTPRHIRGRTWLRTRTLDTPGVSWSSTRKHLRPLGDPTMLLSCHRLQWRCGWEELAEEAGTLSCLLHVRGLSVVWILGAQTVLPAGAVTGWKTPSSRGSCECGFKCLGICFLSILTDKNVRSLLKLCFWGSISFLREGLVQFPSAMIKPLVWPYNWGLCVCGGGGGQEGSRCQRQKENKQYSLQYSKPLSKSCPSDQMH